jgi:hypothetical protein
VRLDEMARAVASFGCRSRFPDAILIRFGPTEPKTALKRAERGSRRSGAMVLAGVCRRARTFPTSKRPGDGLDDSGPTTRMDSSSRILIVFGRAACWAALSLVVQRANGDERGGVRTSGAGCASVWLPRSRPGVTQWGREIDRRPHSQASQTPCGVCARPVTSTDAVATFVRGGCRQGSLLHDCYTLGREPTA